MDNYKISVLNGYDENVVTRFFVDDAEEDFENIFLRDTCDFRTHDRFDFSVRIRKDLTRSQNHDIQVGFVKTNSNLDSAAGR